MAFCGGDLGRGPELRHVHNHIQQPSETAEKSAIIVWSFFFLRPHGIVVHAGRPNSNAWALAHVPVKACPCFSPVKNDSEIGQPSSREVPTAARELVANHRPQTASVQTRLANHGVWNGLYTRRSSYFQWIAFQIQRRTLVCFRFHDLQRCSCRPSSQRRV